MRAIPRPGLLVPNPDAPPTADRFLPADGADVPDTQYWRRRDAEGDVSLERPPAGPEGREAQMPAEEEKAATPPAAAKPPKAKE